MISNTIVFVNNEIINDYNINRLKLFSKKKVDKNIVWDNAIVKITVPKELEKETKNYICGSSAKRTNIDIKMKEISFKILNNKKTQPTPKIENKGVPSSKPEKIIEKDPQLISEKKGLKVKFIKFPKEEVTPVKEELECEKKFQLWNCQVAISKYDDSRERFFKFMEFLTEEPLNELTSAEAILWLHHGSDCSFDDYIPRLFKTIERVEQQKPQKVSFEETRSKISSFEGKFISRLMKVGAGDFYYKLYRFFTVCKKTNTRFSKKIMERGKAIFEAKKWDKYEGPERAEYFIGHIKKYPFWLAESCPINLKKDIENFMKHYDHFEKEGQLLSNLIFENCFINPEYHELFFSMAKNHPILFKEWTKRALVSFINCSTQNKDAYNSLCDFEKDLKNITFLSQIDTKNYFKVCEQTIFEIFQNESNGQSELFLHFQWKLIDFLLTNIEFLSQGLKDSVYKCIFEFESCGWRPQFEKIPSRKSFTPFQLNIRSLEITKNLETIHNWIRLGTLLQSFGLRKVYMSESVRKEIEKTWDLQGKDWENSVNEKDLELLQIVKKHIFLSIEFINNN